jgi:tubulin polyglutamylase TTLL1/tubulin monoglycylase TTLL3/8
MLSRKSTNLFAFNNLIEKISKNRHNKEYQKPSPTLKFNNTFVIEKSLMNPLLDYTYLIRILKNYGLIQSYNTNDNHLFGIINNKFYDTNFFLLNNFQMVDSIANKFNLYFNLKSYYNDFFKKYYPDSFYLDIDMKWKDIKNNIYIARPISGESGQDIEIVHDENTFENSKKILLNPKYSSTGVSLTEYVQNPLLYDGKKMHLRCYFLITLINNTFNSYLLDVGCIYTAKLPYVNHDWKNKDIHDTHLKSTGKPIYFPDDLYEHTNGKISNAKDYEKVYKNICENLEYVSKITSNNIYQFSTAKNTWEVYGIDVLVRDDLSCFIMEINDRFIGYQCADDKLFKKYFDWIDNTVIKPCLFPNLKITTNMSTTSIYTCEILNY